MTKLGSTAEFFYQRLTICRATRPLRAPWGARGVMARLCGSLVATITLAVIPRPGFADVMISVDKNTQHMTVSVNGAPRYDFAVSTGRAGYGTPNGTYHPQRLERTWFSKEYYNSPMPYSIFFHGGFAIHGSYEISRLGGPASHGCIRLHPANAAKLFALVGSEGMDATTIVVSGSNPAGASQVARRHGEPTESGYQQPYYYYGNPYGWPQQPSFFYSPYWGR